MWSVSGILEAIGASDNVITVMGPTLTIVFAWLGGFGVTQIFKFPMSRLISAIWLDWSTRSFAALATTVFAWRLNDMNVWVNIVIGVSQPTAVWLAYKRWPQLRMRRYVGSKPMEK
jgi:hypothetical protein